MTSAFKPSKATSTAGGSPATSWGHSKGRSARSPGEVTSSGPSLSCSNPRSRVRRGRRGAVEAFGGRVDDEPSLRVSASRCPGRARRHEGFTRRFTEAGAATAALDDLEVKPAKLGPEAKQDNSPNLGRPRLSPLAQPTASPATPGVRATGPRPCLAAVAGVVDVLAGDPIRRDLQALRATARVAEQPPASTSVSLPERTRRECAPTPNAGFCNSGTLRKLAVPKTSFRSAAVIATVTGVETSYSPGGGAA